jgi:hypothetical protein
MFSLGLAAIPNPVANEETVAMGVLVALVKQKSRTYAPKCDVYPSICTSTPCFSLLPSSAIQQPL